LCAVHSSSVYGSSLALLSRSFSLLSLWRHVLYCFLPQLLVSTLATRMGSRTCRINRCKTKHTYFQSATQKKSCARSLCDGFAKRRQSANTTVFHFRVVQRRTSLIRVGTFHCNASVCDLLHNHRTFPLIHSLVGLCVAMHLGVTCCTITVHFRSFIHL
jgi:hypothetical protein